MKKVISAIAVFAFSASLAVAAPYGDGHRGFGMSPQMAEKLNLTDAQKQQIRDLNQTFREQNKAFFEASRQTFREFREAKRANDTAKMDALKPALEASRAQMKQLREAQREKIRAILTDEQRAQLDALRAQRQK